MQPRRKSRIVALQSCLELWHFRAGKVLTGGKPRAGAGGSELLQRCRPGRAPCQAGSSCPCSAGSGRTREELEIPGTHSEKLPDLNAEPFWCELGRADAARQADARSAQASIFRCGREVAKVKKGMVRVASARCLSWNRGPHRLSPHLLTGRPCVAPRV